MIGIMTAAGKGSRMKALTGVDIPKVLLKIKNKPIIAYGIESMREMGIDEIFVIAHINYKKEFEEAIGKYNVNITYIDKSDHIMDSVEQLCEFVLSSPKYLGENAVYWLADNIFIGDEHKEKLRLLDNKMPSDVASTGFLLVETTTPQDFITMHKDGSFSEKPSNPETNLSATGVFLVNKKAMEDSHKKILNERTKEYTIWDSWMRFTNIISESISDVWIDVGTPERYLEVKKALEI